MPARWRRAGHGGSTVTRASHTPPIFRRFKPPRGPFWKGFLMPLLLDKRLQSPPANLSTESTVGDFLKWAQTLLPEGRIVVKILRDEELLEDSSLARARRDSLGKSTLSLTTADRKELSLTMLGKLAALIEWLTPQHKQ